MRMQDRLRVNSNKIKKSHILLIGSFLIFMGIISLFWNSFIRLRDEVYSDMRIAMMGEEKVDPVVDTIEDVPTVENVDNETNNNSYVVDYSKYLAVLEIPKIGLKRGFYDVGSKYNNIQYNVTMVQGSTLPDVENGNLILIAHSGDAYISYFAYLYRLSVGDMIYVTYGGRRYQYQLVNIYEVEKNGVVSIQRNHERTTLTMITCTKNNDYTQSVYISELVG